MCTASFLCTRFHTRDVRVIRPTCQITPKDVQRVVVAAVATPNTSLIMDAAQEEKVLFCHATDLDACTDILRRNIVPAHSN